MDNTYSVVSSINKYMAEYIIKELESRGIKDLVVSHGAVLLTLHFNGDLNYKELSAKTNKSPQTMTTLVKKLQLEQYVENKASVLDKRNKVVGLTKKGELFIPLMMDISTKLYEIQYRGFTEEEIQKFREYINKMNNNLKDGRNEN